MAQAIDGMKVCSACGQNKPVSEYQRSSSVDGYRYRCKECDKAGILSKNGKYSRKPNGNGKLRPWKVQHFQRIDVEYRTVEQLPSAVMPIGWYVLLDDGDGVPTTDVVVQLALENKALRARVKQLEAQA